MKHTDPEFLDRIDKTAARVPRRVVRVLIYAHALAALLTASHDALYVARFRGLIGWDNLRDLDRAVENISILAFMTAFLFPVPILVTANRADSDGRELGRATLATFALAGFQLFAILPAVQ